MVEIGCGMVNDWGPLTSSTSIAETWQELVVQYLGHTLALKHWTTLPPSHDSALAKKDGIWRKWTYVRCQASMVARQGVLLEYHPDLDTDRGMNAGLPMQRPRQ